MSFSVATWNINSVRLRIGLVADFLTRWKPDVLCLQETKCPQGQFPSGPLKDLGYRHIAEHGQSGHHGVAIVSRVPFENQKSRAFCGKTDCRHVQVAIPGAAPVTIHNLYVPAGGDEPDPAINEKFDHKLKFIDELEAWFKKGSLPRGHHGIVVGDLNVAPLEEDVWNHKQLLKVVSHTPVETDGLKRVQKAGKWRDLMREKMPPPEKIYTWWSYRAQDWRAANRGRRLDHIWSTAGLSPLCESVEVVAEARGWAQPSDHVPVIARFALPA